MHTALSYIYVYAKLLLHTTLINKDLLLVPAWA